MSSCAICEKRKARRRCPGVAGDICPQCCGEQREVTVDCPLDCRHLLESRQHERRPDLQPQDMPEKDLQISESFLERNFGLTMYLSLALFQGARSMPGTVDADVVEALKALVKTYRTLDSGLIYETRSPNPFATAVRERVKAALEEFQERVAKAGGTQPVRDADVLGALAFLERMAWQHDNGRRRGKAFLSFLQAQFPRGAEAVAPAP